VEELYKLFAEAYVFNIKATVERTLAKTALQIPHEKGA
jgi:hypothetical protein